MKRTKVIRINGVEYVFELSGTGTNINIVDNLETTDVNSALSANQGVVIKEMIDSLLSSFDEHSDNTTHVTSEEKELWNTVSNKVDKVKNKDLSTNDFTNDLKSKLENIDANANNYTHPSSGVTAGSYRTVTVDVNGHVTAGSNPTTLSGYGITDAETKGTTSTHNTATDSHNDIRLLVTELTNRLNALADSDDTTLDQMSEIVEYIKANKALIDSVTTNKVNVSDIVANLTTNVTNKPLAANQGVALKNLIDTLQNSVNAHNSASDMHVTSAAKASWNAAATNSHTHSNKSVLDGTTASYTTEEKTKLGGIATGAEVNQNTFSNVVVGSTTIAADAKTDTLTIVAGSNVTITPDATNDKITIAATDTTYSAATKNVAGLMSAADKIKLDAIATGANNYTHPTTSGNKHIPSGGSSGQILRWSADGTAVWGNDNNTTYSQATSSALGLVKIGYTTSGKNYAVALDSNGKMYVNVPWTDNNTTYSAFKAATSSAAGGAGLVPAPAAGAQGKFLRGDGTWQTPTNTTYSNFVKSGSTAAAGLVPAPPTTAGTTKYLREDGTWTAPPNSSAATQSAAGLMSAADKTKLDGIATGATKITVDTALSSTSTNPVQNKVINTALAGKAASTHTHDYLPLTGGTLTGDVVIPTAKATLESSIPVSSGAVTISSISELPNYKTYIGSMVYSDAWNDMISVRHRNGYGDGNSYGMYMRTLLTAEGNLLWGKQYAANKWQAERTIIDSGNYTSYLHNKIKDIGNNNATTFAYSKEGMSTTSWFACWNQYELRGISPANALSTMGGLAKSGGTMTGTLTLSGTTKIVGDGRNMIRPGVSAATNICSVNYETDIFGDAVNNISSQLRGYIVNLSASNNVTANKSLNVYSDARLKTDSIVLDNSSDITDKYLQMWDTLQPRRFKMINDNESGSYQLGYYAQEVEESLYKSGLSDTDFNGIVKLKDYTIDSEDPDDSEYFEHLYTLSYEQCAMLDSIKLRQVVNEIIPEIQRKHDEEKSELLAMINDLQAQINDLKGGK